MVQKILATLILGFTALTVTAQINLNAGLVANYPFLGNANDVSGNGNNPTTVNATLTTDHYGNPNSAYYFDGSTNYIEIPNSASIGLTGQMSIYAYFKPEGFYYGTCHGNAIVDKAQDFTAGHWSLRYDDYLYTNGANCSNFNIDSVHELLYAMRGNTTAPLTQYTPYMAKGQWFCAVMTQDATTLKLYINGVLISSSNSPLSALSNDASSLFFGKHDNPSFPYWFKGVIDEVRIYNRALSALEVDSLCNLNYTVSTSQPVIINKYAAVLGRLPCDNTFTVDTATGFNAGDTVLMIQMKGAAIDSSNTASFGNVTALNGAGNYEYNIIKAVSGNNITLKYKVVRQYNIPSGRVQFVRVANFQNYTVSQPHTALAWTGTKGGVFIANVANTLTLNDKIDVSGKGFKGGKLNGGTAFSCNNPDYFYPLTGNLGAMKGEGIAEVSPAKMYGRGKLANGGGGGNATNAGGGGGSNAGVGGNGGNQWALCDTNLLYGGKGGTVLTYTNAANRIYLGGGGGTGHENNGNTDSAGSGGGIVIISAGTVVGTAAQIKANGTDCIAINAAVANNPGDGQSGGGAGGAVILKVATFNTQPAIEAKGGSGGNEVNTNAFYGPGGGGGGGAVLFAGSTVSAVNISTNGGISGVITSFNNTPYHAQAGNQGLTVAAFPFIQPQVIDTFRPNTITIGFTDSIVNCFTRKLINTTTTTGTGAASYSWNAGAAGTSTIKSPTFTFPGYGTYPVKLIVTDSNGCKDSLTKNIIIPYVHFANAGADTTTCLGVATMLHASGGVSYSWSPGATLTDSNAAVTIANPSVTTDYIVTVTSSTGCVDMDTATITLVPGAQVVASPHTLTNCLGKTVQLAATGVTNYQWSPATGLSNPAIANPIATVQSGSTTYIVTGKDNKGCISFDSVLVTEAPGPVVDAYADGDGVSCYSRAIQLHASGALSYHWQPGAYLNDSTIASPTATPPRTTTFTVVGTDATGCSGRDTITIISYGQSVVYIPNAFTPNGDHINDDIRPIIFCDFTLDKWEIFNRWGQSVYQGYNLNRGWDGSFKEQPAPMDVYMYYVRGKNDKGEIVIYKGNITLMR